MLFFLTAYNYTPWVILTLPENQDLLFYFIYLFIFLNDNTKLLCDEPKVSGVTKPDFNTRVGRKLTVRGLQEGLSVMKLQTKLNYTCFHFRSFSLSGFLVFFPNNLWAFSRFWQGWLYSMKQMLCCQDVHWQLLLFFIAHFPWSSERNCTLAPCY